MTKEELKYKHLEDVLKEIIANHVALNQAEEQRNNKILKQFLHDIIENMKKNHTFKSIYTTNFYGGSYYDGLKVSKPDEYDLDLLLTLPKLTRPKLRTNDEFPGYVQIRLENVKEYEKQKDYAIPGFAKTMLDDDDYLSTDKVLYWMKSVFNKALNQFTSKTVNTDYGIFRFKQSEGGPAFTVILQGTVDGKRVNISVDLVPCFVFTGEDWPKPPFRQNEVEDKNQFFVVPKQPDPNNKNLARYWRLSFQQQEAFLIEGLQHLKPALKLIKRIRDVYDHKCISSYFIKTLFLWEVYRDEAFWNKPLSYVFVTMLKIYKEALDKRRISYYWDKNNNLIEKPRPETLFNFSNKIQRVINDFENYLEDPPRVFRHFMKDVPESAYTPEDPINDIIENLDLKQPEEANSRCTIL